MDNNSHIKTEDQGGRFPEIHIDDSEELPVINLVLNPEDPQSSNTLAENVPLFIKKLWKIVNDESNKQIISWNSNGDGFIIHDQLQLISKTLPRYFKHNQLSSFVRQLNFYDFHKIQHLEKDEFQFSNPFFLKDLPQLLPLIKRKTQTGRPRTAGPTTDPTKNVQQSSSEIQEIMTAIKDIKTKSDGITTEMSKLRQENAALWGEMNSLRLKYSKQTKIINKLIHFLIAYMQKHHNSRKSDRTVSTSNSHKYLKTGPKIMELDYRYKNNPHEFWSDFDNQLAMPDNNDQEAYTVIEPTETNSESDNQARSSPNPPSMRVSSTIEEILPRSNAFKQVEGSSADQSISQLDYDTNNPSSSKTSNSALQRAGGSKENVAYLIDNSRVEMNTIKELFKNLTPEDMTNFYKLVNENYKIQEDDLTVDSENELTSLAQMYPIGSTQDYDDHIAEDDLEPLNNIIDKHGEVETSISSSVLDNIIREQTNDVPSSNVPPNIVQEPIVSHERMDDTSLDLLNDDLLNTDELLNNVSVDQYFNID